MAVGARAGMGDLLRDEVALLVVAFGCAVFLLLGIVAPRELARTTWEHRGGTRINDSPAGYVGLVSLCGVAALAALTVGVVARRWAVAAVVAALVAAAAFAYGAYVVGN
ncbi:MAG: hypothetical protein H0U10_14915, partial [Chloroflexia bacterium]|nr:hypothetical protein [Chloroflexia bacterium]